MPDESNNSYQSKQGSPVTEIRSFPLDGNPHVPSPALDMMRTEGPACPIKFVDGHEGLLVTDYDFAKILLSSSKFSQLPQRFLLPMKESNQNQIDKDAQDAINTGNLLSLDGQSHSRMRRLVTNRLSIKSTNSYKDFIKDVVSDQLRVLLSQKKPADLSEHFSNPISIRNHCQLLGVPITHVHRFAILFDLPVFSEVPLQDKIDFLREVIEIKRQSPGNDLISDLLALETTTAEVVGMTFQVAAAGRDSVAYVISTAVRALLSHKDQLLLLQNNMDLLPHAVEELLRYDTMFVTLFPRTATEELEINGVKIHKGQTVAVSPVAANRDPKRFDNPNTLDFGNKSVGHLAFGHGPHACLGQQFARLQILESLLQLIRDIPTLSLVSNEFKNPYPLASMLPTYEIPEVMVTW